MADKSRKSLTNPNARIPGEWVSLGWLIDLQTQQVEIYRPKQTAEILNNPQTLSGEEILPGFILFLARIWSE
ncbi:MAG: Uma2 family endonuclease [Cyanobacteria bacterium P01_H01_bin.15]